MPEVWSEIKQQSAGTTPNRSKSFVSQNALRNLHLMCVYFAAAGNDQKKTF